MESVNNLSFDKEYSGAFTLWFHLGKEFAGLNNKLLGSFAIVLQNKVK